MVDAEAQTDAPTPATVVGVEQDLLMGVRVRKSFGSQAFWGTVVGCYWVSGGLFYKVSFDDGDVDILSADEVLQDAQQAKKFPQDNPQAKKTPQTQKDPSAADAYFTAMRYHCLKRKREDPVDNNAPNVRRVQLWGQRLYASIYTNDKNETFIKEMLKTEDGAMGEMEATGQVKVGDMILAVNQRRVLGLESRELAELIRKLKRPIAVTFYRPQRSQLPVVQQQQQAQASASASASASVPAEQATTAKATPTTQPAAAARPQAAVIPHSFFIPQSAVAQPASMAQGLAQSWTPPPMNMQQPHGMTNRELLRQRLLENAAARQPAYAPGYPMGGVFVPASHGVPAVQRGGFAVGSDQQMQQIVDAAAMRPRSSAGQPVRPTYQRRPAAQAPPIDINSQWNQQQRARANLALYEQAQQRTMYGPDGRPSPQPQFRVRAAHATSNGEQTIRLSTNEPGPRTGPSQSRSQQNVSRSKQNSNQEATSARSSAENTPRESPQAATNALASSTSEPASSASILDLETIAALAEKDAAAAAMSMSFLSPHTTSDLKAGVTTAAESFHPTSFLSPNDFNEGSKMPSRQELSAGSAKRSKPSPVKSNVSLTTVVVHGRRLFLTLGVQGTLIAVTSFVRGENGQRGEVEASSQVFLGDVLVRINETYVSPGMNPSDVADIVNSSPRPLTLWFERASWDILNGKA